MQYKRRKTIFRSFHEARSFARSLQLKNFKEWLEYSTSTKKPKDIPTNPSRHYKQNWKDLGDWLGTDNIAPKKRKFRSFKKAREYAKSLNLNNFSEWVEYYKSKKIPNDVPTTPNRTYKNKGWIGWGGLAWYWQYSSNESQISFI